MTNEVSKPMSYHMPADKICEKLKKKDTQICELKYGRLKIVFAWDICFRVDFMHCCRFVVVSQPCSWMDYFIPMQI